MIMVKANSSLGLMLEALEAGLHLERRENNVLWVTPEARLSSGMRRALTEKKYQILGLLAMRFVIGYSKVLERTIFFAEDEAVKNILIEAGADGSSIYTLAEIQTLAKANLQSVISAKELCVLHEAKQTFNGRFTE